MKQTNVSFSGWLYLLIGLLLSSCSKNEVEPADKTDALSNTVWIAYGFKSIVTNRDVYDYLEFKTGGKGQQYAKYNKTDLVDTTLEDFTYSIASDKLTLVYPSRTVVAQFTGDKIKRETQLVSFVYSKQ